MWSGCRRQRSQARIHTKDPAIRRVGGDQVLEGRAPDHALEIVADDLRQVLHLQVGAGAGLRDMPGEGVGQGTAPFRAPGPGDQAIELLGGGHAGGLGWSDLGAAENA